MRQGCPCCLLRVDGSIVFGADARAGLSRKSQLEVVCRNSGVDAFVCISQLQGLDVGARSKFEGGEEVRGSSLWVCSSKRTETFCAKSCTSR